MIHTLKGKVSLLSDDFVVLEVNNIGFKVFVSHANTYKKGEEVALFIYEIIREEEYSLVGFKNLDEKILFLNLMKVKGIGPKTILNALSASSVAEMVNAIKANNVTYLKRLPGFGLKTANQIILDLGGRLAQVKETATPYQEAASALRELGFKVSEIESVLGQINEPNLSSEKVLQLALIKIRDIKK